VRSAYLATLIRNRYGQNTRVFCFAQGDERIFEYLSRFNLELVKLGLALSLTEEEEILAKYPPHDLCVMDMLESTPARQALWQRHGGPLVLFDELCQHKHLANLVVCAQLLPSYPNYRPSVPGITYCKGTEFFVIPFISEEGANLRKEDSEVRQQPPYQVLVMVGGGGIYPEAYLLAAQALHKVKQVIALQATFILGYDFDQRVADSIAGLLPDATLLPGVSSPMSIMTAVDLGIFSGGYSKYEAAYTGLPIIMLAVQEHQVAIAEVFAQTGAGAFLGPANACTADDLSVGVLELLKSPARRQVMRSTGQTLIDGWGGERILNVLDSTTSDIRKPERRYA